ncbi:MULTISPECIES: helix-hairpin-helix domain-containing protein [Thioalkalivibrio]|uniref:ComEA family DNA-binding protein n=1 Tax=Thioalkalivibrio TaxID=106633 RepID=UPI0003646A3F|nr:MULTISPECIES: helix-hairpin-helix domain-containing protein [Thioalkalivibrio]OOC48374.1 competence protein ComEA [Thioalkalivibrio versutus]
MKKLFQCAKCWALAGLCVLPLVMVTASGGQPLNVNGASAEELAALLDNVGPVKAQAIVEHREVHGEFASVQALTEVSGIGERTVEMNLDRIVVE